MMTGNVPPPLKKQGLFAISMLNIREIVVLAVFVGGALVILFNMPGSLPVRIFLAVILAGSGLALAFTTIQGEKAETWVFRTFMFRASNRTMIWRRGEQPRPVQAQFDKVESEPEEAAPPPPPPPPSPPRRYERPVRPELVGDLSFVVAMANVVIFAIFASLTAYIATGGAQQMITYVNFIFN